MVFEATGTNTVMEEGRQLIILSQLKDEMIDDFSKEAENDWEYKRDQDSHGH